MSDAAANPWARVGRGPKRRTRWDRPAPPHDWRFFVGWTGRVLIITGLLMFLFVGYQLWGTGIETARAQNRLENEFEQLLAAQGDAPPPATASTTTTTAVPATTVPAVVDTVPGAEPTTTTTPPTTTTTVPTVPAAEQNLPTPERGDAMARLVIPRINLNWLVVSGVSRSDLKQGPGHFRDTPFPGQLGNAAIAGHRTTSGAPFSNLDELAPGDDVEVTLANGEQYVFVVTGSEVVTPSDYHVISNSDPTRATLTLVTCTPEWTSTHRLIVYADLDPARSGVVGEPIITGTSEEAEIDVPDTAAPAPATTAPTPTSVPGSTPATVPGSTVATVATTAAPVPTPTAAPADHDDTDAFSEGWFADSAAWPQIALWGAILAAFVTGGWWLARFFKREWVGVLAAFVPFTVALYFFFQNVNRLLPAGL